MQNSNPVRTSQKEGSSSSNNKQIVSPTPKPGKPRFSKKDEEKAYDNHYKGET